MAVLTGDYPRDLLMADSVRYAAGDGRMPDLKSNPPATLVPWISENWRNFFKWDGQASMPEIERRKLRKIIVQAHLQDRRVRFWNSPDQPVFWKELLADGVDLINTDDLAGFQKFYNGK